MNEDIKIIKAITESLINMEEHIHVFFNWFNNIMAEQGKKNPELLRSPNVLILPAFFAAIDLLFREFSYNISCAVEEKEGSKENLKIQIKNTLNILEESFFNGWNKGEKNRGEDNE